MFEHYCHCNVKSHVKLKVYEVKRKVSWNFRDLQNEHIFSFTNKRSYTVWGKEKIACSTEPIYWKNTYF